MKKFKSMTQRFESDVRGVMKNGIELIFYMRGAISIKDMYDLTVWEKDIIAEFIKEHLERETEKAKNSNQPMVY